LFSSDGAGSLLDLSSFQSFNSGFDDSTSSYTTVHRIIATNGGSIDLSGVQTILGPVRGEDRVEFIVGPGGSMDLSSLQVAQRNVRFEVQANGNMVLGNLAATSGTTIALTDVTSALSMQGTLYLDPASKITVAAGGQLSVHDDFWITQTSESSVDLDEAVVYLNGSGVQYLEVGGEDLGLTGSTSSNFGIGRLVIGEVGSPTTVMLLDLFDNGNRTGGESEALYLYGLGGLDGLEIADGSTLVLDGLDVYAMQDLGGGTPEWVHLNSLFTGGTTSIPFAGGTVMVAEPSTLALLAALAATLAFLRRRK
ncbi:MAG: PEP-CTERM sorting domain-containing protein, partial [Pirellulales bacterium]|nr:PEP-CTERM sorting domain-containing protein [Pirellulales bacterium]